MAIMMKEVDVSTIGELKAFLKDLPDEMEVFDAVGELLCVRIFEDVGMKFVEVA